MSIKTKKIHTYYGLGFPIQLHDVEMVRINGELHPKIDVRDIAEQTIKSLVLQKTRLTGNQIKFIRTYFSKSLREFSDIVNESHMAVKKWENCKDNITNMDPNIEILLRLYIFNNTEIESKNKKKIETEFYGRYITLTEIFSDLKEQKKKLGKHKTA